MSSAFWLFPASSPLLHAMKHTMVGGFGFGFGIFIVFLCFHKCTFIYSKSIIAGIPGWRSGLAPALGPGRLPGDPG